MPHPPRSLQYEMTPEGVSRISWRSPEPAPYDLQYEVRYSVNATEKTWTNVEGVLEAYVTPGDLKAGLDYTAQARCKWDRRPGLWSNWSEPLYIKVQDVNFLISCETNGYQTSMTCKWNPNGIELPQGSSVRFMYRHLGATASEDNAALGSSGQLTGKPAGAGPDHRGRWCPAETIENLFKHHERLTSGLLLLESERISEAVIVEKMKQSVEEKETRVALDVSLSQSHEAQQDSPPSEQHSHTEEEEREPVVYPDSSGEPKIEYATILPSDLYKQQKSISSSSDEGNFSANNSDISGSFPNNLWEVENQSCIHLAQVNPLMLRSFNSSEGFSEASDDQDDSLLDEQCPKRDIYYLEQVSTEEEGEKEKFLEEDAQVPCQDSRDETGHEANPLLSCHSLLQFKMNQTDLPQKSSRLYMPQFRAVSNTIPKKTKAQK
ncbi:UNVERIFIED_CONTAM: hypothetical protein FKN15_020964 [Acipenser sinensis]